MSHSRRLGLARNLAVGALAGAVGTAAMDLALYARYRRDGGEDSAWRWESAQAVTGWDTASAPGQIGQKIERAVTRRDPPERWARATTNVVHWATGIGWGLQYGAVASLPSIRPLVGALALGPAAWLSGYVLLPLVGVYEPIWRYDATELANDLSVHLVYGAVTSSTFAALRAAPRPGW